MSGVFDAAATRKVQESQGRHQMPSVVSFPVHMQLSTHRLVQRLTEGITKIDK